MVLRFLLIYIIYGTQNEITQKGVKASSASNLFINPVMSKIVMIGVSSKVESKTVIC